MPHTKKIICSCNNTKSHYLRCILGELQDENCETCCCTKVKENAEERKYKNDGFVGSFHKGLQHDINGKLVNSNDYICMKNSIIKNDQIKLNTVPLATGAKGKFVNPLASLSHVLIGAPYCAFDTVKVPALSTHHSAAEMVELYCQQLCRDVPFISFGTDPKITKVLGNTYMNDQNIIRYLPYFYPINININIKTLFKGTLNDEQYGPYISQLLYLNVPLNGPALIIKQEYSAQMSIQDALPDRVEWGINKNEIVIIQNSDLNNVLLPPITPSNKIIKRYINTPRVLAEVVHNDPAALFYLNAAQILSSLGASPNPGFPVYTNQIGFITNMGGPSVQCAIAEVAGLALKHAWYWKWQVYRRLRPEAYGLLINDVMNNNSLNNIYNLDNIILNSPILNDIKQSYNTHYNILNSYTLSSIYREASPLHPAFPSGHAVIAGACCTILKLYFDTDKPWHSLSGVMNNLLSNNVQHPVQSNIDGSLLVSYTDGDKNSMTINGEINKLASNASIGRNWAGIHYRSDALGGIFLGEQVAMKYMGDLLASFIEKNINGSNISLTFRKFDGSFATVTATNAK